MLKRSLFILVSLLVSIVGYSQSNRDADFYVKEFGHRTIPAKKWLCESRILLGRMAVVLVPWHVWPA